MEFSSLYSYDSYSVILWFLFLQSSINLCTGSGWLVGFLIEAIVVLCFRIVTETLDNTPLFQLLLSSVCAVSRHSLSLCSSYTRLTGGVHKKWRGSTTRTADPKMCCVLCLAMKAGGGALGRIPAAQRLAGHWAACGRWPVILSHLLVCFTSSSFFLFPLLLKLNP